MSIPTTQTQYVVTSKEKGFDGLIRQEGPVPKPGANEVLVRLYGASLNYRDLIIPQGLYPFPIDLPVVAASDGAGEVVAVGEKVTKWKKGDKVTTLFNQFHQYGDIDQRAASSGLGGVFDGTLRQYGVFNEDGVVRTPSNLNHVEAATLVCAGVTSWNALYGLKTLKPGQFVLTQGTGGVSLFALQFAKAGGAKVIATTSSKEKCEMLKKLGADYVINYNEDKNWGETARALTPNNQGIDHIIEVGGAGTLGQSMKAIKYEGIISIIGFLGGAQPKESILDTLSKICTVRGVYVGSKQLMEEMCLAIEANNIKPVVDKKIFKFDEVKEAYKYMWAQKHFGKVGISIE
ncbi:hypothetical protein N0V85_006615 [Neurospora sp. IMI 360204]|nr:hypothetical protein N0V85_006615 [Neurospora sp. IMI 360204]